MHCCGITFNGGNSAVVAASDLACYDLTPATINCVIGKFFFLIFYLYSTLRSREGQVVIVSVADTPPFFSFFRTASDPFTNGGTCSGNYACCQVNDLVPLLGLFCSDPPGGCVGSAEGNGECTDILSNGDGFRFGQCGKNDVRNIRGLLGLSVGDVDVKKREEVVEKREALLEGKRRELVEMVRMGEL